MAASREEKTALIQRMVLSAPCRSTVSPYPATYTNSTVPSWMRSAMTLSPRKNLSLTSRGTSALSSRPSMMTCLRVCSRRRRARRWSCTILRAASVIGTKIRPPATQKLMASSTSRHHSTSDASSSDPPGCDSSSHAETAKRKIQYRELARCHLREPTADREHGTNAATDAHSIAVRVGPRPVTVPSSTSAVATNSTVATICGRPPSQ
mmetsp:Transcript_47661/g.95418  ORF Transcript_47661/g.95418 Transcript_47661/m.95418 type:complete len:208 (+) Transcript_47661:472-1095(+)